MSFVTKVHPVNSCICNKDHERNAADSAPSQALGNARTRIVHELMK
jgi:hypothetical protein